MRDADADADTVQAPRATRSNTEMKKQRVDKLAKVEKKKHRREKNSIAFAKHPKKGKRGGKP